MTPMTMHSLSTASARLPSAQFDEQARFLGSCVRNQQVDQCVEVCERVPEALAMAARNHPEASAICLWSTVSWPISGNSRKPQ
jgi:hypothetical protein